MIVEWSLGSKKVDIKKLVIENLGEDKGRQLLEKTGPKFLQHADENENSLSLGVSALKKLLDKLSEKNVDLNSLASLISVSESPKKQIPGNSFDYISLCNLPNHIFPVDINAGCTGFVDALRIANSLKKPSIIVTSETYSKRINGFERNITPIFADGASATYFNPDQWTVLYESSTIRKNTSTAISCTNSLGLKMNGPEVVDFVMGEVVTDLEKVIKKYQPSYVFAHQGSKFVVDFMKNKLSNDKVLFPENISEVGNTVSSTIPILFYQVTKISELKPKTRILFTGFGVGLSHSVMLLEVN
jgi:3-oxoacyl-[acyl-carrier-protein] synthase-3